MWIEVTGRGLRYQGVDYGNRVWTKVTRVWIKVTGLVLLLHYCCTTVALLLHYDLDRP